MPEGLFCPVCEDGGHIACHSCGSLFETSDELLVELQDAIHNLNRELAMKLRKIRKLMKDSDLALHNDPKFPDAMEVLEFWSERLHPTARELDGGERLRNVLARLRRGYTVELLKNCVLGYEAFPYIVNGKRRSKGSSADRMVDAELIFRAPKQVDQGLAFFKDVEQRRVLWEEPAPLVVERKHRITDVEQALSLFGQLGVDV